MSVTVTPTYQTVEIADGPTVTISTPQAVTVQDGSAYKPFFDVRQYGAVGDGSTDDTTAIQNAINDANVAGGIVWLPAGTYKVTSALTLKSSVTILGVGALSVIKGVFSSGTNAILKNDFTIAGTDLTLARFKVDRTGTNAQHGILIRNFDRVLIDGVHVVGSNSSVVASGAIGIGGFAAATATDDCQDVRVVNCYVEACDNFGVQLGGIKNGVVANNTFQDAYREAVGVEPGVGLTAENVAVVGNTIVQGSTHNGSSTSTGVIIATTSSGGTLRNVTITGNTVIGAGTAADASPGITVLDPAGSVTVSGNTIRNANGPGIDLGNASVGAAYCTVVGNTIRDCNSGGNVSPDGAGIKLRGSGTVKNLVAFNIVSGSAHTHGIEETSSAANNNFVGNVLLDNVAAIGTLGTGSFAFANRTSTGAASMQPSVSGSRGGNAALASLLSTLAATPLGLITDGTTA